MRSRHARSAPKLLGLALALAGASALSYSVAAAQKQKEPGKKDALTSPPGPVPAAPPPSTTLPPKVVANDLRDLLVTFKDAGALKLRSSFNSSQLGTKFASDVLEIEGSSGVTVSERGKWSFSPPTFKVSIAMNAEARAALDLCLRLVTAPANGRALTLEFMRLNSPAVDAYSLSSTVLDVIRPLEMGFINCSLD
ncbi:hypothetical protein [Nannocystis pusilla]|uniref:hypothetical protein n=1 Tax=Nannocystis pusilla TaxID=889268 RepID=UPI003BF064E8